MFEPIIESYQEPNITAVALDFQSETLLNQLQPKVKNIRFSAANGETDVVFVFTHLGEHFNREKVAAYLAQHQEKFLFCVAIGDSASVEEQEVLAKANGYSLFNPQKAAILLSLFDEICNQSEDAMVNVDVNDLCGLLHNLQIDVVQVSDDSVDALCSQLAGQIGNQVKGLLVYIISDPSLNLMQMSEIMDAVTSQVQEDTYVIFGSRIKEDIHQAIQVLLLIAK